MTQKIRLAIAGFGLIGQRHGEAISDSKNACLSAIIDPSDHGAQTASARNIPYFADLESFFSAAPDGTNLADGLILSTPNTLHVSQGLLCLDHGFPILVEKPIGTSSKEAQTLVDKAADLNIPLLTGHHRRHNPLIQAAKQVIDRGDIGQVRAVQATCWFYKPDAYFDIAPWRKEPGAGPIAVNLVHDVDLIRFLCGEVLSVTALSRSSIRGYQNEDVAGALMDLEGGAIATITVSDSIAGPWSWELTAAENPAYPTTHQHCYQIGGSKGSLSVPDIKIWRHADGKQDWWTPLETTYEPSDRSDPLVNQIENFADAIQGKAPPLVPGVEGLKTLKVIEAIQRSSETGERVWIH